MSDAPQTYATHRRLWPPFHFVLQPILLGNFVWAVSRAVRAPDGPLVWGAVVAFALLLIGATARMSALRVQDRLIQLEMRLRCKELLPAELFARFGELRPRQVVALRFAGDRELPELVRRTLAGEFAKPDDIKRAITEWKADYLRV